MIDYEVGRAVLYQRVSSASQTGPNHVSLDVQEDNGNDFVTNNGGHVVARFVDPAKSGKFPNRVQYQALIDMCRNREVDTVVVFMLDRIGRNVGEYCLLIQRFKAWGVRLVSVCEPYLTDNPGQGIQKMLNAQEESEKISARVKPAHRALLEAGLHVGRAPLGYDIVSGVTKMGRDGRPKTGKDLKGNKEREAVERLFDLYATGEFGLRTLDQQAEMLLGRALGSSSLNRLLRNPVYLGYKVWGKRQKTVDEFGIPHVNKQPSSKWFVGDVVTHEALVKRETWDKVQEVLNRNKAQGDPVARNRQLLVGMIYCSCGSRMQTLPNRGYANYACQRRRDWGSKACSAPNISVRKVDPVVKEYVEQAFQRLDEPAFFNEVLAQLAAQGEAELEDKHSQRRHLEGRRTLITNELKDSTADLMRHVITREEFELVAPDWRRTLATIEATLADLPEEPVLPNHARTLRQLELKNIDWKGRTLEGWREFLQATVERVTLVAGEPKVDFKPHVQEIVGASALIRI